ncbi:ESPR domain-containing protein [Variovorax paradoxus]|uniref:ESPR domain-containing protein n=1 Tax=Variovorax paradoxus TaxID=34073 RepID=UPI0027D775F0|nr:ESPR domain-containing protein [Variovorax paradoxus]
MLLSGGPCRRHLSGVDCVEKGAHVFICNLKKLANVNDFAFSEGMQGAFEIVQIDCIRVRPVPGSTRAPATPAPHAQFKQGRYLLPGTQAMNRIFRVVWNDALARWAVASERGHGHARSTAATVGGGLAPPAGTAVVVTPGTTVSTDNSAGAGIAFSTK